MQEKLQWILLFKLLQSEALSLPCLLPPFPNGIVRLILEHTFLVKKTSKGNGIKAAAHLQQTFLEKDHAQIFIRGKKVAKRTRNTFSNKSEVLNQSSLEKNNNKKKQLEQPLSSKVVRNVREAKTEKKVTEITLW